MDQVSVDEIIAAGSPWSGIVEAGSTLRIVDLEGHQGVDFLCYNADDPQERYNAPNTIKAAGTIALNTGIVLYSDRANPLMTLVEDTCGDHDTIGGCCSVPSNQMLYGVTSPKGCREIFLEALAPFGLGWSDLAPNINFFCDVPVNPDRSLAPGVFATSKSKAGDYVDLRADMRVLVAISNCPQINNPCNDGAPTPIRILVGHST
jgi:hypothetical protein